MEFDSKLDKALRFAFTEAEGEAETPIGPPKKRRGRKGRRGKGAEARKKERRGPPGERRKREEFKHGTGLEEYDIIAYDDVLTTEKGEEIIERQGYLLYQDEQGVAYILDENPVTTDVISLDKGNLIAIVPYPQDQETYNDMVEKRRKPIGSIEPAEVISDPSSFFMKRKEDILQIQAKATTKLPRVGATEIEPAYQQVGEPKLTRPPEHEIAQRVGPPGAEKQEVPGRYVPIPKSKGGGPINVRLLRTGDTVSVWRDMEDQVPLLTRKIYGRGVTTPPPVKRPDIVPARLPERKPADIKAEAEKAAMHGDVEKMQDLMRVAPEDLQTFLNQRLRQAKKTKETKEKREQQGKRPAPSIDDIMGMVI